jgi:DNA-binding MarR family transcriptional regulator
MVTRIYDDALRPFGVKVSQMNILVVVAKLGTARAAAVAETLELEISTLSRNLERMRAKGWLEEVAGEDARVRPFRLSAKGRRLLDRVMPAWEDAQRQARTVLGQDGVEWLKRISSPLGGGSRTG